ncbi:hypothetical protein UCRNP2_1745 [Neofusicoccum parvum UCRNP2]|uniref:Uncharacterized protein n=1 Tax=Botryosphaeria parva (strain UCR-NP2) TaxID=1287680 RepID=R1EV65_BOTPV|nr:hypothetical protein UCRNP2_1745 [Neofusicoccum parvum UCRNP2]
MSFPLRQVLKQKGYSVSESGKTISSPVTKAGLDEVREEAEIYKQDCQLADKRGDFHQGSHKSQAADEEFDEEREL